MIAVVSKSGFYKHFNNNNISEKNDFEAYSLIKKIFDRNKGKIGAKRIYMDLKSENITMNLKKIRRIMKKYNLVCKIRRKNKARITLAKNKENMHVSNVLNRNFKQNMPYNFASTDITYLKYKNIFSFLSVIKDLASGEILAWRLSKDMNLNLVINTILKLKKYSKKNGVDLSKMVLYSDQGF